MSRADERIRGNLQELERPVRTDVFESVAGRKHRRRALHRVGMASLAVAVVGGSLLGGYGLLRVFGVAGGTQPVDDGVPTTSADPSDAVEPPVAVAMCDASELSADLNGDGIQDRVEVWTVAEPPGSTCEQAETMKPYEVHVTLAPNIASYSQSLPECDTPFACGVLAAPDIDRDGRAEIAIKYAEGVSTVSFGLYRFGPIAPDGVALQRLEIAEPGDPWDPTYGLAAGPATFTWYGSVTHQQWLSCDEDPEHRPAVMTALRSEEDPGRYLVHGTLLRLVGQELRPEFSWDEEVREDRLRVPTTMCGAELIPAG